MDPIDYASPTDDVTATANVRRLVGRSLIAFGIVGGGLATMFAYAWAMILPHFNEKPAIAVAIVIGAFSLAAVFAGFAIRRGRVGRAKWVGAVAAGVIVAVFMTPVGSIFWRIDQISADSGRLLGVVVGMSMSGTIIFAGVRLIWQLSLLPKHSPKSHR